MGYTSYWKFTDNKTYPAKQREAIKLIEYVLDKFKDIICYECDKPDQLYEITDKQIRFNGKGEDGHETFILEFPSSKNDNEPESFCKTARKPYDLPVCITLLILKAYLPNFEINSDGFCGELTEQLQEVKFDGEWNRAIEYLKKHGITFKGTITNTRDPYCDLMPVLVDTTEEPELAGDDTQTGSVKHELATCRVCGHQDVELYSHIRTAHDMSPDDYMFKYAEPLVCTHMHAFATENNLRMIDDLLYIDRLVFGHTVTQPLDVRDSVPAEDSNYHFCDEAEYVSGSILHNDRVLLVGHTGCGKSSLVEQIAARLNHPLIRFNLHGETASSDFIGQHKVINGEMKYQYGVLPRAMREGQILVLEELDAADPSVLFTLQGVLEPCGKLVIADNGGEIIEPHKDFRLVATANTLGCGDDSGLYAGTNVLNASFLDRWGAVFELDYLPEDKEAELIMKKVPELAQAVASQLVQLAAAVRKAYEEEQLSSTFSTRRLLALAEKVISYKSAAQALRVTVLNKLPASDRAVVLEISQRILGR